MEIRSLSLQEEPLWDGFCRENSGAWFGHTTAFLKYQHAYRPSLETSPRHFLVLREGRPVALCPLAAEKLPPEEGGERAFSLGGDFLPAPVPADALSPADRERILRLVFQEVDKRAQEEGVVKASFRDSVLTQKYLAPPHAPPNDFVRFGCIEAGLHSQVLDLRLDEGGLWAGLRRSYHSLIHRAGERLSFRVLDHTTVTEEAFKAYRELHHKDAGRVTRPLETFRMMLEWIRSGGALLGQIHHDGKVLACALLIVYKDRAQYASACTDPEAEDQELLGPLLQWRLIQELKRRGATHYELGWQLYGPQLAFVPTEKEARIAFFKRGFGGLTLPFHRGEKYYSPSYFRQEYFRRVEAVAQSLLRGG